MTPSARVRAAFSTSYGQSPTTVWSAPGRVNLIGEHTDYNDGFVLPFAIEQRTAVAVGAAARPAQWTVCSEMSPSAVTFTDADLKPGAVAGWAGYVAGVVAVLRDEGIDVPGAHLAICSDVPVGAGLSSSAALECATLAALLEFAGVEMPLEAVPRLAQRAENVYAGVPCGILDQSASTLCREGNALFLDCRDQSTEHVPFALADAGLAMLIVDTRAPHRNADGEYAERRTSCEAAAATLGLPALRDVTDLDAALSGLPDEVQRRRVRHIVTENDRVLATVALLRQGRIVDIGPLLTASHASMRDDFEISVPELDTAVDAALAAGAYGARMTGAGFGGCIIALVRASDAPAVAAQVEAAFADGGYRAPAWFVASPAAGVARQQ